MKSKGYREIKRQLQDDGFEKRRQVGSHEQWVHPLNGKRVTLPVNVKEYKTGTLRSIYTQAAWKWPP